jgi:hypothetical protein
MWHDHASFMGNEPANRPFVKQIECLVSTNYLRPFRQNIGQTALRDHVRIIYFECRAKHRFGFLPTV